MNTKDKLNILSSINSDRFLTDSDLKKSYFDSVLPITIADQGYKYRSNGQIGVFITDTSDQIAVKCAGDYDVDDFKTYTDASNTIIKWLFSAIKSCTTQYHFRLAKGSQKNLIGMNKRLLVASKGSKVLPVLTIQHDKISVQFKDPENVIIEHSEFVECETNLNTAKDVSILVHSLNFKPILTILKFTDLNFILDGKFLYFYSDDYEVLGVLAVTI